MKANTSHIDALALIQERNEFYKRKYHQILGLILLCLIIIGVLLTVFFSLWRNTTRPFYFPANLSTNP